MTDNSPFDEFFDFDEPDDDLYGFDGNAVDDGFGEFAEYGTAYSSERTTSYSAAADDSGYDDEPEAFFREEMFSIADIWKEYPKTVQWDTELMAIGDHTMRATIMQRQQTLIPDRHSRRAFSSITRPQGATIPRIGTIAASQSSSSGWGAWTMP